MKVSWHPAGYLRNWWISLAAWLLSSHGRMVVESVGFEAITAQQRNAGLAALRAGPGGGAGKPAQRASLLREADGAAASAV